MTNEKLVQRFAALFSGYSKAYGQFEPKRLNDRNKMTGRSFTIKEPVTLQQYQVHLDGGGPGLGIVMLRDDETCLFGSIDIDDPTTNHADLETKVRVLNLPLVVVRSKSKGAHLHCFLKEPVEAPLLQRKLSEWCALLGYSSKTEIFPKQTQRVNPDDTGNWINLPYYKGIDEGRVCFDTGKEINLKAFLDVAESKRVSLEDLTKVTYDRGDPADLFYEGPPCMQHLHASGGFVMGTMRDGMFSVAVYVRKRYPDDWENRLAAYNKAMCHPELRNDELQEIISSLKKKPYDYKCKTQPLADYCQRKLCVPRKFGIGDAGPGTSGLEIGAVTCYMVEDTADDPMWGMEIAGQRMLMDHDTFFNAEAFNKKCLATIRRVPVHVPQAKWKKMVDELAANSDIIYTPREASDTGNLIEWVRNYLMGSRRTAMDQIADSGSYTEEGFVYFRVMDLFSYLDARRVTYDSKHALYHLLKQHFKGTDKSMVIAKSTYKIWKVPAIEPTDIKTTIPDFKQTVPF